MKKHILIIVLTLSFSLTWANVTIPRARISEIFFDSTGNWTIELGFYAQDHTVVDSIRIESSSGSSIVLNYSTIVGGGYPNFDSLSVINNSNLKTPISIDPSYDYIKVISYTYGYEPIEYLAIGNYPSSYLDCIESGESIAYLVYTQSTAMTANFCIDNSPTIGFGNDTTGVLGTFSGVVYDLNGELIVDAWFSLPDNHNTIIHIDSDGLFSERIFSRKHTFDTIELYFTPRLFTIEKYAIEPVDFCLRPDSSQYIEIITTSLITGVEEQEEDFENAVVVVPNPFTNKTTFYFKLGSFNPTDRLKLIIIAQNGSVIEQIELSKNQKSYEWQSGGLNPSGIYFFQLLHNEHSIKSGKLIKL